MTREKPVQITIDNRTLEVNPGMTILQAARGNGIFIPSLCTLEHLPSYGACRLCMVEVDGLRGFPTSCTTPVEKGMVIRTDTAELRSLRQEILKLLLSEHPASCLFCDEKDDCKKYQGTIRKVGLTTGCRYCPNDDRCELQEVVEKVGLTETSYPVYYRNFPAEKDDPFYDRDYNLCVLCGRCVRVCNSVRLNGTLSFKQRGKQTTIGPAFTRSHLEAGCEFCGACLTACPTGALSPKVGKWAGKPDRETLSTCPYCPVGCRIRIQSRHGEVVDVLPDYDSPIDRGLLCVKGRFGIPEYVNSFTRYMKPRMLTKLGYEEISWDRALESAAAALAGCAPEDALFMVSPQLSNEDLFAAQAFARQAVGSDTITSSVTISLGEDLIPFLNLAMRSVSPSEIGQAQAILSMGFDSTYGFSPLGVAVKEAVQRGIPLVSLASFGSNMEMPAEAGIRLEPSRWPSVLDTIATGRAKGKGRRKGEGRNGDDPSRLAAIFSVPKKLLVAGPGILTAENRSDLLGRILAMAESGWDVIFAHPYTNLPGMLAMGLFPGVKPGEAVKGPADSSLALDPWVVDTTRRRRVVYLVGEAPSLLPDCDFLIYQNALPASSLPRQPDLVLPSALFIEAPGTTINLWRQVLGIEKAADLPAGSRPDWVIFSQLAKTMGKKGVVHETIQSLQSAIRRRIRGFPDLDRPLQFVSITRSGTKKAGAVKSDGPGKTSPARPFLLYWKTDQDSYRGIPLAQVVTGMAAVGNREFLVINAEDAVRIGVADNQTVMMSADGSSVAFSVRTSVEAGPGTVHLVSRCALPFSGNPCAVEIRRSDE